MEQGTNDEETFNSVVQLNCQTLPLLSTPPFPRLSSSPRYGLSMRWPSCPTTIWREFDFMASYAQLLKHHRSHSTLLNSTVNSLWSGTTVPDLEGLVVLLYRHVAYDDLLHLRAELNYTVCRRWSWFKAVCPGQIMINIIIIFQLSNTPIVIVKLIKHSQMRDQWSEHSLLPTCMYL